MESVERECKSKPSAHRPRPQPQQQQPRYRYRRQISLSSVRLNRIYFVPWILASAVSIVGIVYNWYYIEDECWDDPTKHVTVIMSIALFSINVVVLNVSCLNSCLLGVNGKIGAFRMYLINFAVICLVSVFNLILAIFAFMQKSCYLALLVPEGRVTDANFFGTLSVKYDIKLSGTLHLLVAVFGFLVAMSFAIIKNNYKYIKQIDLE